MKQYDYILLDWDGNLAKTLDIWLEATRVMAERRGIELTDNQIAQAFGAPFEHFALWGITDLDAAITEMDNYAKQRLPEVELYPDALEVLETLHKRGKHLALITASIRKNVMHLLEKYNLLDYFEVLITNEDSKHHKPHPEPLEKALGKLGGSKENALMIGDSDKDLGAGINAHVDTILFYPPEHTKFYDLDELKKHNPTYIVDDFREVLNIAK